MSSTALQDTDVHAVVSSTALCVRFNPYYREDFELTVLNMDFDENTSSSFTKNASWRIEDKKIENSPTFTKVPESKVIDTTIDKTII